MLAERHASNYSPSRRTAAVFCGVGTHGAYHAGVLRALHESGVKIDIVAGQGVGAATALLAAIDGGARLWDTAGVWSVPAATRLYGWKWPIRAGGWLTLLLATVLLSPLLFLAVGLLVYPLGFLLEMLGLDAGRALLMWYGGFLAVAFAGPNLPTVIPRIGMLALGALVGGLAAGVLVAQWRAPARRRSVGGWWWRIAAAPVATTAVQQTVAGAVWQLIRGAAPLDQPAGTTLSRRYAEVLGENLGQPGFRELMIVTTDLDTRQDVVAALLREPYRRSFVAARQGRERAAEALDLLGPGRDHAIDVLNGALTPPWGCDPHLLTFAADSYFRGETHRVCDRPGSLARLLGELADAGVAQAILVGAVPVEAGPHRLAPPRLDLRHRMGDALCADVAAGMRDALTSAGQRFDAVHLICPAHNPIGAFEVDGAYDSASDRTQTLRELLERGYEDACRQFIEPVVGASGEHLASGTAFDSQPVSPPT